MLYCQLSLRTYLVLEQPLGLRIAGALVQWLMSPSRSLTLSVDCLDLKDHYCKLSTSWRLIQVVDTCFLCHVYRYAVMYGSMRSSLPAHYNEIPECLKYVTSCIMGNSGSGCRTQTWNM